MGKDLADTFQEARNVFAEVDEALGQKLSTIMFEGPDETLRLTENAQPALMAVSVAVTRVLESRGVELKNHAAYVAGHSLGEYSALAAAGAFSLGDAARLLKTRGQAMQQAVPVGQGAMAAILGLDLETVLAAVNDAAEGEVCGVANDNAPGQVVISGHVGAVNRAIELLKAAGAKRALLLPVSAPFHCALMRPAADAMLHALNQVAVRVAARAAGRQRGCQAHHRPRRDQEAPRRAGHRHGALDRVRELAGQGWRRHPTGRTRLRQGALRPRQAHRPRDPAVSIGTPPMSKPSWRASSASRDPS